MNNAATLTISGGYISQGNFIAVKNDENGILNITGGTIVSNTQAVQNWCEAEISGGELTGAVTTWAYGSYDGETVISGGKIDGDVTSSWFSGGGNMVQDGVAPKVTITGGEIKGELYQGKRNYNQQHRACAGRNRGWQHLCQGRRVR